MTRGERIVEIGRAINAIVWSLVILAVIGIAAYAFWP
jgi:hypothetical protein